ncbi:hypothetical protein FQN51_008121, partial [Onygenales sp. PD_10]
YYLINHEYSSGIHKKYNEVFTVKKYHEDHKEDFAQLVMQTLEDDGNNKNEDKDKKNKDKNDDDDNDDEEAEEEKDKC